MLKFNHTLTYAVVLDIA